MDADLGSNGAPIYNRYRAGRLAQLDIVAVLCSSPAQRSQAGMPRDNIRIERRSGFVSARLADNDHFWINKLALFNHDLIVERD